jgi:hypothetical protein
MRTEAMFAKIVILPQKYDIQRAGILNKRMSHTSTRKRTISKMKTLGLQVTETPLKVIQSLEDCIISYKFKGRATSSFADFTH